jgi:hypothetical protein
MGTTEPVQQQQPASLLGASIVLRPSYPHPPYTVGSTITGLQKRLTEVTQQQEAKWDWSQTLLLPSQEGCHQYPTYPKV